MRQQFAGKGNPDGVVAHAQPFAGGAVFYLDSDGIDGYHEDKQHQYARCKGVAQIYGVVQPRVIEWMRIYDVGWRKAIACSSVAPLAYRVLRAAAPDANSLIIFMSLKRSEPAMSRVLFV